MNWVVIFIYLSISLTFLPGCGDLPQFIEPHADVTAPQTYKRDGLQFKYPGNWKVQVEKDGVLGWGVPQVNVSSPSTSSVIIHVFPAEDAYSLKDFGDKMWRSSVPGAILSDSNRTKISEEDGFEVMTDHFSVRIFDETLTHQRVMRRKQVDDKVFFVTSQVPTDDLAQVKPGFDLVASSVTWKAVPETEEKVEEPSTAPDKEANKTKPKAGSEAEPKTDTKSEG